MRAIFSEFNSPNVKVLSGKQDCFIYLYIVRIYRNNNLINSCTAIAATPFQPVQQRENASTLYSHI